MWFNSIVRGIRRFFQQTMYSLLRLFTLLSIYTVSFIGGDNKSTTIYHIIGGHNVSSKLVYKNGISYRIREKCADWILLGSFTGYAIGYLVIVSRILLIIMPPTKTIFYNSALILQFVHNFTSQIYHINLGLYHDFIIWWIYREISP